MDISRNILNLINSRERFEMLCDEDLTIDKEKFSKLMRTNADETQRVNKKIL